MLDINTFCLDECTGPHVSTQLLSDGMKVVHVSAVDSLATARLARHKKRPAVAVWQGCRDSARRFYGWGATSVFPRALLIRRRGVSPIGWLAVFAEPVRPGRMRWCCSLAPSCRPTGAPSRRCCVRYVVLNNFPAPLNLRAMIHNDPSSVVWEPYPVVAS
jgi:hypothetical protein